MGFLLQKSGIGIDEKKLVDMVRRSDFNPGNIKRRRELIMIEFQRFMVSRIENRKKQSYFDCIYYYITTFVCAECYINVDDKSSRKRCSFVTKGY